jgi:hypothetical protein
MMIRLAHISDAEVPELRRPVLRAFGRPPVARPGIAGAWVACTGLLIFCLWCMHFAPQRLWPGDMGNKVVAVTDVSPLARGLAIGIRLRHTGGRTVPPTLAG